MTNEELEARVKELEESNKKLHEAGVKLVLASRVYMSAFGSVAHFSHQEVARIRLNGALDPWENGSL